MKPEKFRAKVFAAALDAGATDEQADVLADHAVDCLEVFGQILDDLDDGYRTPKKRELIAGRSFLLSGGEGKFNQIAGHVIDILELVDNLPPLAVEMLLRPAFGWVQLPSPESPAEVYKSRLREVLLPLTHWSENGPRWPQDGRTIWRRDLLQNQASSAFPTHKTAQRRVRVELICEMAEAWNYVLKIEPAAKGPFLKAATVALLASGDVSKPSTRRQIVKAACAEFANPPPSLESILDAAAKRAERLSK